MMKKGMSRRRSIGQATKGSVLREAKSVVSWISKPGLLSKSPGQMPE